MLLLVLAPVVVLELVPLLLRGSGTDYCFGGTGVVAVGAVDIVERSHIYFGLFQLWLFGRLLFGRLLFGRLSFGRCWRRGGRYSSLFGLFGSEACRRRAVLGCCRRRVVLRGFGGVKSWKRFQLLHMVHCKQTN